MADISVPQNVGGQYAGLFTGGNVETLIYTGSGRVSRLFITTAGTAVLSIYDGTQSTGGTLIYTSITNDLTAIAKDLQIPVANGIVVKGTTGTAGASITYNKTGVYGN